ncbi:hypothetical protein K1719_047404, partial [Acacia pycnantha]
RVSSLPYLITLKRKIVCVVYSLPFAIACSRHPLPRHHVSAAVGRSRVSFSSLTGKPPSPLFTLQTSAFTYRVSNHSEKSVLMLLDMLKSDYL